MNQSNHPPYGKSLTATVYVVYEGRVLLHMHKKYNTWFPVGGHLEPNELPHIAAMREVYEEAGLTVNLINMRPETYDIGRVQRVPVPYAVYYEGVGHEEEFLDFIYFAQATSPQISGGEGESKMLRWFSLEELEDESMDIKIHIRNTAIHCLKYLQSMG